MSEGERRGASEGERGRTKSKRRKEEGVRWLEERERTGGKEEKTGSEQERGESCAEQARERWSWGVGKGNGGSRARYQREPPQRTPWSPRHPKHTSCQLANLRAYAREITHTPRFQVATKMGAAGPSKRSCEENKAGARTDTPPAPAEV